MGTELGRQLPVVVQPFEMMPDKDHPMRWAPGKKHLQATLFLVELPLRAGLEALGTAGHVRGKLSAHAGVFCGCKDRLGGLAPSEP